MYYKPCPRTATHAEMLVKRAMLHCGGGLRKKRCTAGVRDEETERGDRKSLTLNPCLPLPRPASHPQHSGLSPPAWVTSPIFFVSGNFPPLVSHFALSLFSLFEFCCSNSISHSFSVCQRLRIYPKHVPSHLFVPLSSLPPCYRFIASQLSVVSISISLCSLSPHSYMTFFHFCLLQRFPLSSSLFV